MYPFNSSSGIVFGALLLDGSIDIERMNTIRKLSEGMILTFHRAFDVGSQLPTVALEQIISIGCDRLLTSGGNEANAEHNLSTLQSLVKQAGDRILIVVAAGISAYTVRGIIITTGVKAIHAGRAVTEVRYNTNITNNDIINNTTTNNNNDNSNSCQNINMESSPLSTDKVAVTTSTIASSNGSSSSSSSSSSIVAPSDMIAWSCVNKSLVSRLASEANLAWKAVETEGISYYNSDSIGGIGGGENHSNVRNVASGDGQEGTGDTISGGDGCDMVLVEAIDGDMSLQSVPHDSAYVYVSGE